METFLEFFVDYQLTCVNAIKMSGLLQFKPVLRV